MHLGPYSYMYIGMLPYCIKHVEGVLFQWRWRILFKICEETKTISYLCLLLTFYNFICCILSSHRKSVIAENVLSPCVFMILSKLVKVIKFLKYFMLYDLAGNLYIGKWDLILLLESLSFRIILKKLANFNCDLRILF